MNDTAKLLERVAKKHNASDYRIAKILGVSRSAVSNWRVGKGSFSDKTALKVAELLNDNPGYVLAVAAAERATDENARHAWATLARRLQRTAAALLIALTLGTFSFSIGTSDSRAGVIMSNMWIWHGIATPSNLSD